MSTNIMTWQRWAMTLLATTCFAAQPVARLICSEPVDVDGISVPARNYTPVGVGNEITTHQGAAVLQFRDGTSVVLQPNSQLRIEGQPGEPRVHILRGAAQHNVVPASKLTVSAARGEKLPTVTGGLTDASAATRLDSPMAQGVAYRSSARQPGTVVPSTAISVASFSGTGVFHGAASGGSGATITLPSGVTLNLQAVTNSSGVVTGYTISSITTTVTQPNGTVTTLQVTSGSLIGDTVTTAPISGGSVNNTQVIVGITPTGSSTPLTSAQAGQAIQTAVNTAVTTGVQNGTLQSGTQPPTPAPVSTGQFSPSAT